jgi:O-antigen/teichoic acid export membrane protein
VIAFCSAYGVAACINLAYLFSLKKISLKPNLKHITKPLRKDFFYYTLFLMGAALTTAIVPNLGSFFIAAKLGLACTGVYVIAQYMTAIIEIPYRSLGAISNPHISQTLKEKDFVKTNQLIKKISLHQFLIGAALFFVIWTNIDTIFQIIPNGENFVSGKWVVFILGLSTLLSTSLMSSAATLSFSKYYYYSLLFTFILTVSAVVMNIFFIPVWGINGAAISTLFSFVLYYIFLLSLVYWKLKVSPFSFKHLKILSIVLILFLFDYLWKQTITHLVAQHLKPDLWINFCEAALRTAVLGGIGFFSVYFWNISDEVNHLVRLSCK